MIRPQLFLSAVSAELCNARQVVASAVRKLGYDPVFLDNFKTGHGEVCAWLRTQIDECEGLIQLVGTAYGFEPPAPDPDFGRVSYTQFEMLYALAKGKKTWVIVIGSGCPRDAELDALDLPTDTADEATALTIQNERRELQHAYVVRLKKDNHLRHRANNLSELEIIVRNMSDELSILRRADEARQRRLWRAVIGILTVLGLYGIFGWWVKHELTREVQQVAAIDAEKIRTHLRRTIEDSHRRELAAAAAEPNWPERERLRKAADAVRGERLDRIDALIAGFAEIESGRGNRNLEEMRRVLAERGVDDAIAYVASQRSDILASVRARAAMTQARNREELAPLLQVAALHEAKGESKEAAARYEEVLGIEPDWPTALHLAVRFHTNQGDQAMIYASLSDAAYEYAISHKLAQHLVAGNAANTVWQCDLAVSNERIGDVLRARGDELGALDAHRRSLIIREELAAHEPANTEWQHALSVSHLKIGDVLLAQGDGAGALESYSKALALFEEMAKLDSANTKWQRGLAVSFSKIGDVRRARGYGQGALESYGKARTITETLAKLDLTNTEWQHDLSVSHEKSGDVLRAQGDVPGALEAYRKSLHIRLALAELGSASTQWQRGLSVSFIKIGDVLRAQGDGSGALESYRKALTITDALATRDRDNTQWQFDLSVTYDRIGDVLRAQGDGPGALDAHRKSLKVREALAARDQANTEWQHGLGISNERIGDALIAQGDLAAAMTAYRRKHLIAEALAAHEPANTEWQRDLAVSFGKIGNVLRAQGDGAGALRAYRNDLAITEAMAKLDRANTEWQRDLSVSHLKIGDVLRAQGDGPEALEAYRKALLVTEVLAARDPTNAQWQYDLSICHDRVGDVLKRQGDLGAALEAFRAKKMIIEALAVRDPSNAKWQRELIVSHVKLNEVTGEQSQIDKALAIAEAMQARGILAPRDAWMVDQLRRRKEK